MTAALGAVANWYTDQLANWGWLPTLSALAAACVAGWCGLGAALNARDRRRAAVQAAQDGVRVAENYANHDSVREAVDGQLPARKETP
ncbi:hypothetical protein OG713_34625 [Streptomyces sp. NBC_00723]|uniref:hypothetical protein n=1 Tax=Streptomyces sp. NBC_00723 TaxID=2903673 RepID=UPI00386DC312